MTLFSSILSASVFLGTQFAITLGIGKMSLYRLMIFLGLALLLISIIQDKKKLVWDNKLQATKIYIIFIIFFFISLLTIILAKDVKAWFRAAYFYFLGFMAISLLFFTIEDMKAWRRVMDVVWIFLGVLVFMGLYEYFTKSYLFSDAAYKALYRSKATYDPMIPFTIFANGNDYATLLVAYLALSFRYISPETKLKKLIPVLLMDLLAFFLIAKSTSRMAVLSSLLLILIFVASRYKFHVDVRKNKYWICIGIFLLLIFLFGGLKLLKMLKRHMIIAQDGYISSEQIRVNVIKSGILYLARSWGLGIGIGNVEYYLSTFKYFPTRKVIRMHNWFIEILVSGGILSFISYIAAYGLIIFCLFQRRRHLEYKNDCRGLIAFAVSFILTSGISSSMVTIEWHWVVFALMLSFIKVSEMEMRKKNELEHNN